MSSLCTGELPVIVNFTHFDNIGGFHNVTIVANSTDGEVAEFNYTKLLTRMCLTCHSRDNTIMPI